MPRQRSVFDVVIATDAPVDSVTAQRIAAEPGVTSGQRVAVV